MGCDQCREELSARLDGESARVDPDAVDAHVAQCAQCRQWLSDAAVVTRLVRTDTAVPGPVDISDAVLAAAPGPGRARLARALRVVLGGLGVAQLCLGLVQVAAVRTTPEHTHGEPILTGTTSGHLWHESAAWNVAIGVGFLWLALRRTHPGGIAAVLSAFVAVLALLNVDDLIAGRVEPAHLATHGFILTGYLIVLALSRPGLRLDQPPNGRQGARPWWRLRPDGAEPAPDVAAATAEPSRVRQLPAATASGTAGLDGFRHRPAA